MYRNKILCIQHFSLIYYLWPSKFYPTVRNLKIKKIHANAIYWHSLPIIQQYNLLFFVVLGWQQKQSKYNGITSKNNWYFILISTVVGFFVGIILVLGVQWLLGKKRNTRENPQQGTIDARYNGHADQTPSVELVYDELDLTQVEEENNYQNLQHASWMGRGCIFIDSVLVDLYLHRT